MQNLIIEKTISTPGINFDADSGLLQIKGESFPENVSKFYGPVLNWIKEYLDNTFQEVRMEFEIVYFNSSTSKVFMTIFNLLEQEVSRGKKVSVLWRCDQDNETAVECGEEFKEDLSRLPFSIEVF